MLLPPSNNGSLSQWLTLKLLGITYLVRKIQVKLLFCGPLAEWGGEWRFIRHFLLTKHVIILVVLLLGQLKKKRSRPSNPRLIDEIISWTHAMIHMFNKGLLPEARVSCHKIKPVWWFQIFVYFHPYLWKWSNLANHICATGLKPPPRNVLVPI